MIVCECVCVCVCVWVGMCVLGGMPVFYMCVNKTNSLMCKTVESFVLSMIFQGRPGLPKSMFDINSIIHKEREKILNETRLYIRL